MFSFSDNVDSALNVDLVDLIVSQSLLSPNRFHPSNSLIEIGSADIFLV